jgi:hypothetical protein
MRIIFRFRQLSPLTTLIFRFFESCFNIVPPCTPKSPKWSLSIGFPIAIFMPVYHWRCACYVSGQSHSAWVYCRNEEVFTFSISASCNGPHPSVNSSLLETSIVFRILLLNTFLYPELLGFWTFSIVQSIRTTFRKLEKSSPNLRA